MTSSRPATCSVKSTSWPLGSTNSQPCQFTRRSSASPNPPGSKPSTSENPGALRSVPSSSVRPRVVRADDGAALGCRAARQQFVAAVPAGVGEGADHAVVAAHQQHAVGARTDGPLAAGARRCRRRARRRSSRRRSSRCSHSNTAGSTYASRGSMRDCRTARARRRDRRRAPGPDQLFEHTVRLLGRSGSDATVTAQMPKYAASCHAALSPATRRVGYSPAKLRCVGGIVAAGHPAEDEEADDDRHQRRPAAAASPAR